MAPTLACMRSRGNMPSKIKYAHVDSRDVERAQPALERPLGRWRVHRRRRDGGYYVEMPMAAVAAWRAWWRCGERGGGVEIKGGGGVETCMYCGTCDSFVLRS